MTRGFPNFFHRFSDRTRVILGFLCKIFFQILFSPLINYLEWDWEGWKFTLQKKQEVLKQQFSIKVPPRTIKSKRDQLFHRNSGDRLQNFQRQNLNPQWQLWHPGKSGKMLLDEKSNFPLFVLISICNDKELNMNN